MGICASAGGLRIANSVEREPYRSQNHVPETVGETCRLRIIAINDVYDLGNFPKLLTLIREHATGWPEENFVTTLAGDFLAPSLLSSLDAGAGMVRVLNHIHMDYVCFGNHESDIPHAKLRQRIDEFHGKWLNSNMPDFDPELPVYDLRKLRGSNGTLGARTVAFIGLCLGGGRWASVYRDGAFGGAAKTIVPVNKAAPEVYADVKRLHPEIDEVLPLTHQDLEQDRELAGTELFPVIIAGHDHHIFNEKHGERACHVVKSGCDATHAAIIDLDWPAERGSPPTVKVTLKPVSSYEPDPELLARIERIERPLKELESAVLYELRPDEIISSLSVRSRQTSMGELVATALREVLHCDGAVLNSGAIRGAREYTEGISYGDLTRECPFPSPIVVTQMPFEVLRRAVHESRKAWWDVAEGEEPKESASALQVDDGIRVDSNHEPTAIGRCEPELDGRLYAIACDTRVLTRNPVFREYCEAFPERIPPEDAGRPVLPLLAEFFCGRLWRRLIDIANNEDPNLDAVQETKSARLRRTRSKSVESTFNVFDIDRNGRIDSNELRGAVERCLGKRVSSRIVVEQMISMLDEDNDGLVSQKELKEGITKIISAEFPNLMSL